MAHIFISYSRVDRPTIEKLADQLEQAGHSVWWDRHIRGGASFAKDIEAQLEKADIVVVAWSSDANQSDWVKDEAVYGRDKGILVPICLSACEAPLGFRQLQVIDFQKWKGDPQGPAFQSLLHAVKAITEGEAPPPPIAHEKSFLDKVKSEPAYMAGAAALALAIVAAIAMLFLGGGPDEIAGDETVTQTAGRMPAPAEVSIAVLPFNDLSPEGNQEYFADGLSEELLNVLNRVDKLKVASRTSSFAMKNKFLPIGEIAEQLKVNHVLEGSVQKIGNRVRINAKLIDARDDRQLWSEVYDRHLSDIFRIQDEIATAVVRELRDELGMEENQDIVIKPATENMSAYDKYLKARELFIARGRANVRESLRLFEEVVEEDPTFARGWEGLAAVYAIATSWGITDKDYSSLSLVAAREALNHDEELSMPYAVMGLTYRTHYPTPWAESIGNLKQAIERDPKNANAWLWLGMDYMAIGEAQDAIDAFNQCLEIDEAARLCRKYRSISNLFLGRTDEAMTDAEANAEIGYFGDFDVYIPVFLERGDRIAAHTVARNVYWWGSFPHVEFVKALADPENLDPDIIATFDAWGEADKIDIDDKTFVMLTIRAYDRINVETFDNDYEDLWLPYFADYRKSPEFKQLAADLGLIDYWREAGFPPQCTVLEDGDFECA